MPRATAPPRCSAWQLGRIRAAAGWAGSETSAPRSVGWLAGRRDRPAGVPPVFPFHWASVLGSERGLRRGGSRPDSGQDPLTPDVSKWLSLSLGGWTSTPGTPTPARPGGLKYSTRSMTVGVEQGHCGPSVAPPDRRRFDNDGLRRRASATRSVAISAITSASASPAPATTIPIGSTTTLRPE